MIDVARGTGLQLAVRSGGHSGAGHSTVDGGIVLDVRDLDASTSMPTAGRRGPVAGSPRSQYTAAAAEHKLATGFGDTGSVGLGGITPAAASATSRASTG